LQTAAGILPVEQLERGETDVGHLLVVEKEVLIGQGVVGLRDIRRGRRGRGCAPRQRKPQSGGPQRRRGGSLTHAVVFHSLRRPCHGHFLQCVVGSKLKKQVRPYRLRIPSGASGSYSLATFLHLAREVFSNGPRPRAWRLAPLR
jgi:hypothetical protein